VTAGRLDGYIMSPLVHVAAARMALHRRAVLAAREHLTRAARLRPLLTHAIPVMAVNTLLELGRAYLLLDDLAGARVVLRQAREIVQPRPDLGVLPGQRLSISQHTVKTQAISVYRKLGVSSRSQVVQRLQDLGLIGA
jgi:LuxR family maltose regulon positive regulatory protein